MAKNIEFKSVEGGCDAPTTSNDGTAHLFAVVGYGSDNKIQAKFNEADLRAWAAQLIEAADELADAEAERERAEREREIASVKAPLDLAYYHARSSLPKPWPGTVSIAQWLHAAGLKVVKVED